MLLVVFLDYFATFAMTTLSMFAMTISSAWAGRAPCLGRGNVGCLLTLGNSPRELCSQGLIGAPEATDRRGAALFAAMQVRTLVVVFQPQVVIAGHKALCSTPETRVQARAEEMAIVVTDSRWENIETKGI